MKKTLITLCLPLVLAGSLTACGNDDTRNPAGGASVVAPSSQPPTQPTASAPATPTTSPAATAGSGEVSESAARATALRAAGAGASVRKVEPDDEDGRRVYKYDIAVGKTTRKISVDRSTGKIVKNETDNDNDNEG